MARKAKRRKSVILRLLVLCVSAYMVFSLTSLYTELSNGKKTLSALEAQRDQSAAYNEELRETLKDDKKIIEKAARERLGYAYTDETEYRDISNS